MKFFRYALLAVLIFIPPLSAHAKLNVVTTTTDLAALTKEIGGDNVDVASIAKGYQDPHFVEAKPSYLLKLRGADLFIEAGLELEVAWAPSLLTNARNPKIIPGNPGFLDVSDGCEILQKPAGGVDRSSGDVHPFGNPHYWLDPMNGRVIARHIADRLMQLDPANKAVYELRFDQFDKTLAQKEKTWEQMYSKLRGLKVVTYHNSWPNFAKRFGVDVVGFVEPKAGIPPSPSHVQALTTQMKSQGVKVILMEPYFDPKLPEKIARDAGAKLLIFPPSVGAVKGVDSYLDLFDYNLTLLSEAAQ